MLKKNFAFDRLQQNFQSSKFNYQAVIQMVIQTQGTHTISTCASRQ